MSHTHRGVLLPSGRVEGIVPADSVITARIPAGASVVSFDVPADYNPRKHRYRLPEGATTLAAVAPAERTPEERLADARLDPLQAARDLALAHCMEAAGLPLAPALAAEVARIRAALA